MPETRAFFRQLILNFPSRPEFKFDNFVVSAGSEFAFKVARQISSRTEVPYSTLYLYGNRNLGKTHLLMAIGNQISQTQPEKTVVFLNGLDFVRKIADVRPEEINHSVNKLLEVDYFLLDDVDRVSGQPAAQEKLYHIYNTLTENGKKAVFAGTPAPDKLSGIESYLQSRLQWGMTAEIKPIDDTTTAKIIAKLGADIGLTIPHKIVDYLLARIPRDFISIKNSVEKINQESFIQKKKVSLALAKTALNLP